MGYTPIAHSKKEHRSSALAQSATFLVLNLIRHSISVLNTQTQPSIPLADDAYPVRATGWPTSAHRYHLAIQSNKLNSSADWAVSETGFFHELMLIASGLFTDNRFSSSIQATPCFTCKREREHNLKCVPSKLVLRPSTPPW